MSCIRKYMLGLAAMTCFAQMACANDSEMREEILDLRTKVAGMESAQKNRSTPAGTSSLTSMKKTGSIKIGGTATVPLFSIFKDYDTPNDANTPPNRDFDPQITDFSGEFALKIDIRANATSGLWIKLDCEDMWDDGGGSPDQDDLLEECYFYWRRIRGSNWNMFFGKKEVAYGQDITTGFFDTIIHGTAEIIVATETYTDSEGHSSSTTSTTLASVPTSLRTETLFQGELDNVFVVEAQYMWKDLAVFKGTVFQDKDARGMHEDRSDDTVFFNSYALKAEFYPVEGLGLEASFINRHNDTKGDLQGDAEEDLYALSLGFEYTLKGLPLTFFGEYIHTWDAAWTDDIDSDVYQLGLSYSLTDNIDISLMGEYAEVDDDSPTTGNGHNTNYNEQEIWGAYTTVYYTFETGMALGLEYYYQEWDGDRAGASKDDEIKAHAIGFVADWSF